MGKPEGIDRFEDMFMWEGNMKVNLEGIRWEVLEWIRLAQDGQVAGSCGTVIHIQLHKINFLAR